jgi:hypothetical protein
MARGRTLRDGMARGSLRFLNAQPEHREPRSGGPRADNRAHSRYSAAMADVFEPAASGRSKCRGCGRSIARGDLRFGERQPSLFGEGEMTSWFHLLCAAYKRPQSFLVALREQSMDLAKRANAVNQAVLERAAQSSLASPRIPRIDGAERAPTGQARCRSCREPIARGNWRIRIAYYENGRFFPGGFIHLSCGREYFEGNEVLDQLLHFSPALGEDERAGLTAACRSATGDASA